MSVIIPARAIQKVSEAANADEAKKAIFNQVASSLDGVEVIGDMVLVGVYIRPEKVGSIYRPQTNVQEDVWQGKVGVVLKWGPDAFRAEDGAVYDQAVAVGEWGVFRVGDGWQMHINDYPCRLVKDTNFRLKVKDPSIIL